MRMLSRGPIRLGSSLLRALPLLLACGGAFVHGAPLGGVGIPSSGGHGLMLRTGEGPAFVGTLPAPLLRAWDRREGCGERRRGGVGAICMAKKKGPKAKGAKVSTALKAGQVRADQLLVQRGLADNSNHAMALILKGVVVADEGKLKVTTAGQGLPADVPLRLKGAKQTEETLTREPASAAAPPGEGEEAFRTSEEAEGVVVAHHGSRVIVERVRRGGGNDDERVSCAITPLLKEKGILTGDHVTFCEIIAGDTVATNNTAGRKGFVTERLERKTLLERPAKAFADVDPAELIARGGDQALNAGGGRKLMCANVDQMLIVIAPRPMAPPLLLDSHIVAATTAGIEPVIVLNKCDLLGEAAPEGGTLGDLLPDLQVYANLGYPVVRLSTKSMDGVADLEDVLRDKTSIMVGQSGVGKSSLVNMLFPQEKMRVGDLSEYSGLGSHTTTHAELHHIPSGGDLIDCAGFRDFGTWHLTRDEIQMGFKEIFERSLKCKYRNCAHWKEPDCAVKEGVEKGEVAQSRLEAFHELRGLP